MHCPHSLAAASSPSSCWFIFSIDCFLASASRRTGSLKPYESDGMVRATWLRGLRWTTCLSMREATSDRRTTQGKDERMLLDAPSGPCSSSPPAPPLAVALASMIAAGRPVDGSKPNSYSCGSSKALLAVSGGGERRSCSHIAMEGKVGSPRPEQVLVAWKLRL